MTRATELGFIVSKPRGDMAPFDLALEHHGHFARVQVKRTTFRRGNSYKCHLDSNGVPYRPNQIELLRRLRNPHRHLVHPLPKKPPITSPTSS